MKQRRQRTAKAERAVISYVRVSTEEQATTGVSLAAQEARISAYASAMEFSVSAVIRDAAESAKSRKRPGIAKVLEAVRRGEVDRVVVAKLDRLTRSVRDLNDLLDLFAKHDVSLVSVSEHLDTGSAAGRLVVNMLGVVAQWEREAIGERTAASLTHKRHQRTAYGPTPFGCVRQGNALVPDASEQATPFRKPSVWIATALRSAR